MKSLDDLPLTFSSEEKKSFREMCKIEQAEGRRKYNDQYDAFYNLQTGEWLESKCKDDTCGFCSKRPDKAPVD